MDPSILKHYSAYVDNGIYTFIPSNSRTRAPSQFRHRLVLEACEHCPLRYSTSPLVVMATISHTGPPYPECSMIAGVFPGPATSGRSPIGT